MASSMVKGKGQRTNILANLPFLRRMHSNNLSSDFLGGGEGVVLNLPELYALASDIY